jgi:hypothetical protein
LSTCGAVGMNAAGRRIHSSPALLRGHVQPSVIIPALRYDSGHQPAVRPVGVCPSAGLISSCECKNSGQAANRRALPHPESDLALGNSLPAPSIPWIFSLAFPLSRTFLLYTGIETLIGIGKEHEVH